MVVIYTPRLSPRINYVFQQVFGDFLGTDYRIVTAKPLDRSGQDFILYYTNETGHCDLHIQPAGLLAETGTTAIFPNIETNGQQVKIFVNDSAHFGFDLFSAIFWMLTRYEEYQSYTADTHDRFPAKASMAYQHGFITQPVIDQWLHELKNYINKRKIGLVPERKFDMINTIDVDNAYAYRGKGFWRQGGALAKHFLKGEWKELRQRIKVISGKLNDPFDTYAYIRETASAKNVPTVFFHLAGGLDRHDRNIAIDHPVYVSLINELKTWSVQGIHPSYKSNSEPGLVKSEKEKTERVVGTKVDHSRQHFIKLKFPLTYRKLVEAGITKDFSMGFADHTGFRAGTGRAFVFFDLEANAATHLLVQPFCIMEGTLKDYMQLSPEAAIETIHQTRKQLQELGSTYVAIWHNETLGGYKSWQGWRKVYESQFNA